MIVRGEGCYVWDEHGRRYLDGLAALFCVNVGYGRSELGDAAAGRRASSASTPTGATRTRARSSWRSGSPAWLPATSTACSSPRAGRRPWSRRSSWPATTTASGATPAHEGDRPRERLPRHLARGAVGHRHPRVRTPFEPLTPGGCHVRNTNIYRLADGADPLAAADAIEERILFEGPETVAAVILEPMQNAGGCLTPPEGYFQRVREICDRHGVLLISDEVICSWGRLGHWFGAQRYDYQPDMITTAKGLTSAYAPMGALIASDRVAEPFLEAGVSFAHGFTFGGHPMVAAVALANLDIFEREDLCGRVLEHEARFRAMLESLRDLPIVGDVRGDGYFYAVELVRDRTPGALHARGDQAADQRLRGPGAVPPRPDLPRRRPFRPRDPAGAAADRGYGRVAEIHDTLRPVLAEAMEVVGR